MTTKDYLRQIERLDRMIQNKLSEIYELECMATSVTVPPREVCVQTSGDKDLIGSAVSKIADLEEETNELVDRYSDEKKVIVSQIDSIPDVDMYNILTQRYVLRRGWKVIAAETDMNLRYVMSIHEQALKTFEEMFGDTYLDRPGPYEKRTKNVRDND